MKFGPPLAFVPHTVASMEFVLLKTRTIIFSYSLVHNEISQTYFHIHYNAHPCVGKVRAKRREVFKI